MERPPPAAAVCRGVGASTGAGSGRGDEAAPLARVQLSWPRYDMSRCPVCRAPAPTKRELDCLDCRCVRYCSVAHRAEHLATGGHADECEALCAERLVRWRKGAEGVDAQFAVMLGCAYLFGHCRLAKDASAAASWFTRAADLGDADAQFNLGVAYRDGEGVERDHAEALRRFRQAAEQGRSEVQSAIGFAYYNGRGVPVDFERAAHYWRLGAKGGNAYAMAALGECYRDGKGVKRSLHAARKWLLRAKEAGYDDADDASTLDAMIADLDARIAVIEAANAAAAAADAAKAAIALEAACVAADRVAAELIAEEEAEKAAAAAAKAGKGKGKGKKG